MTRELFGLTPQYKGRLAQELFLYQKLKGSYSGSLVDAQLKALFVVSFLLCLFLFSALAYLPEIHP